MILVNNEVVDVHCYYNYLFLTLSLLRAAIGSVAYIVFSYWHTAYQPEMELINCNAAYAETT